jgi:hypothetical protein
MVVTSINGGSGGTVLNDFNDIADICFLFKAP